MSNLSIGQIIMDAQRLAGRFKDLDTLSSSLLVEAEGNNRVIEGLRQFQEDLDSLNRITNNKTNAEMVNRIQQQNAQSSEILKENRELKICIEDYERAIELIMQKYREHTTSKILESQLNLKELANERLWKIIRQQREKIDEMAAVMQRAATIDDDKETDTLQVVARLRLENQVLRELLEISQKFDSSGKPIRPNAHLMEEKGVQTDIEPDDLSISNASLESANNNSVIQLSCSNVNSVGLASTSDSVCSEGGVGTSNINNNNGPVGKVSPQQNSPTHGSNDRASPSKSTTTETIAAATGINAATTIVPSQGPKVVPGLEATKVATNATAAT